MALKTNVAEITALVKQHEVAKIIALFEKQRAEITALQTKLQTRNAAMERRQRQNQSKLRKRLLPRVFDDFFPKILELFKRAFPELQSRVDLIIETYPGIVHVRAGGGIFSLSPDSGEWTTVVAPDYYVDFEIEIGNISDFDCDEI